MGIFAERTVANLRIAWEININKMANVCSREFALHTVLKNCSNHFLELKNRSRKLEIVNSIQNWEARCEFKVEVSLRIEITHSENY